MVLTVHDAEKGKISDWKDPKNMNHSKDRGSDVSVHQGVKLRFFFARGRLSSGQTEFLGLLSVRVGRYLIFFFLTSPKRACHQTICCAFLLTSSSLQSQNGSYCSFFCGALQTEVIPRKKMIRTKKINLFDNIAKLLIQKILFQMTKAHLLQSKKGKSQACGKLQSL